MTRYRCSTEAASTWGRIFSAFRWRRCKGVMGYEGTEYGGGHVPPSQSAGLETEARILFIATMGVLVRLAGEGGSRRAGAAYTRRKLRSQRVWDVLEDYDMSKDRAEHLWECTKDYLDWTLNRPVEDEPELPW